jgi:hypothetical protein
MARGIGDESSRRRDMGETGPRFVFNEEKRKKRKETKFEQGSGGGLRLV